MENVRFEMKMHLPHMVADYQRLLDVRSEEIARFVNAELERYVESDEFLNDMRREIQEQVRNHARQKISRGVFSIKQQERIDAKVRETLKQVVKEFANE